jgi:hypothetical protein
MNNSTDPIQQVCQIIKNAFDITARHSMSPEVMQKLDGLVQQLRDGTGTKHRPTNEEECAFHFGIGIILSLKCYCAIEMFRRKGAGGGSEDAFRYGLESVKLCQRVRDTVGEAGSKALSKKLEIDLDSLEANTLNEVGFLVLQSGNPEAAIEHMQRAVYLEPRNQKFHSNYAFCLTQVEQKQLQRDPVRCREICDHVSAALQQGPYPGVASVLEEILKLPGLAQDVKVHAGKLQQKLVAQQRSYSDEIALYLHSVQRLSGRIIPLRLVEAQVRPIGDYHTRVESPSYSHQLPCLALRYLATEHLASHELERAVTLLGLAIECHLGIIGERANLRLTSERPLPHPDQLTGPNWLSGSSRVLAIRGCWVLHAAEAKASELQVIIGQLRLDEKMVLDQVWVDSYKVLLLGLMSAAQGTMAVVRVGDSQPFVIKAGTPGIDRSEPPGGASDDSDSDGPRRGTGRKGPEEVVAVLEVKMALTTRKPWPIWLPSPRWKGRNQN